MLGFFYLQAPSKKNHKNFPKLILCLRLGGTSPGCWDKITTCFEILRCMAPFLEAHEKQQQKIIKASLKFSKGIFSRESGCPESLKGEHERHVIMGLAERRCALFIHNQSYFLV